MGEEGCNPPAAGGVHGGYQWEMVFIQIVFRVEPEEDWVLLHKTEHLAVGVTYLYMYLMSSVAVAWLRHGSKWPEGGCVERKQGREDLQRHPYPLRRRCHAPTGPDR